MRKEYWESLKEHDPIHYSEMMGDPVTGLGSDSSLGCSLFLAMLGLVGLGVLIGSIIFK